MVKLVWIAGAGALGSVARYGLSGLVQRVAGGHFPWGTLTVNVAGSFLFGLIWSLASHRTIIPDETKLIFLTGFMGAFTTFSTLMFDTGRLIDSDQWFMALSNMLVSIATGMAALYLGLVVSRLV